MTRTRLLVLAGLAAAVGLGYLFWPRPSAPSRPAAAATAPLASPPAPGGPASAPTAPTATAASAGPDLPFPAADFPLAAELNAPGSTIQRDLDLLQQLLDAWRSNFPGEGNPVGENAEIAAALLGRNALGLALVPKQHPALNGGGELCDRWGTPFRFHQLSGDRMEIRSAGPDRRFATDDDAVWTPP